jgi:hypothetical protein
MDKILYSTTNTISIILIHSNRESRFVNVSEWFTLFQFLDYGDQALVSAGQFPRLFFSIMSKQKCKTGTGTDAYLLTINACLAVFLERRSLLQDFLLPHTPPFLLQYS